MTPMSDSVVQPDVPILQWIASNLHIITKAGTRELLRPNAVQLRLHMSIQAQRSRGLPVRLRLLKFRQWGGCLSPETRVLTSAGRWKRIGDVEIGEELVCVDERGRGGKLCRCTVLDRWITRKLAYRITMSSGVQVIASGDHRFLGRRDYDGRPIWRRVCKEIRTGSRGTAPFGLVVGDPIRIVARPWVKVGDLPGKCSGDAWEEIVEIEPLAVQELVDISTSTRTFIAEGVVSHNSTWIEAEAFYEVWHNPNWRAMAVSVDADSTDHIFGMTKLFEEDMPASLRRPKDNTNRKEIKFSRPHRSQFLAQTAGKLSLGHSFTAQFVHASEIARWENAGTQMAGLQEIVPLKPGTTIIQETTANGQGGYFYDGWVEDIRRLRKHPDDLSGYLPIFVAWHMFPDYAMTPRPDTIFTRDERAIQKQCQLSDEQLYWRQMKLSEMNGDLGRFCEQYPSSWMEAFQTSGNPVFGPQTIATQAMYQGKQFRRVLFDEGGGKVTMESSDEQLNTWLIWSDVQEDHDYAIGIDTMEGRLSDVNNPRSLLDWDAVTIMDRNTGEFVAMYHGRGDQRELGEQALRAAIYYNEAYVAPEIPQSMVLLSYFKDRGYSYLYNRQRHEDRETEGESEVLGWRTTSITRKWLVEDMVVALKEASVKLIFPDLLDEMRGFVRDANGKPGHMPGEHDDLLFSAMIALQVHKHCPMSNRPYKEDHTGLDAEPEKNENKLARVGAVDDWDPITDSEEDENEDDLHTV